MKLTTHKGWKALFLKLANQGPKKGLVFTSYRVPWRVAAVISTHAKKAGTSLTDAVNQIIADWIAKNPAKPDLTVKVSAHAREPVKGKSKGKKVARKAKTAKPAKKVKAKTAKKAAPKKTAPKIKAQAKPKAPKVHKSHKSKAPKTASKPAEAKPAEPASNGGTPESREEQHANAVDGLS